MIGQSHNNELLENASIAFFVSIVITNAFQLRFRIINWILDKILH